MRITSPAGMVPKLNPSKLPLNNALSAVNCRFDDGSLSPYAGLTDIAATLRASTDTIFYYEDLHWFSFNVEVDIVESPVNGDQFSRVYYTGDGAPKMTANDIATGAGVMPVLSYRLGVRQPDSPVISSITNNDQNENQSDDITTFYVCTFVNGYNEEGMPSQISDEVTLQNPDAIVNLTFSGISTNDQNITTRRIYRIADDSYRLVAEIPLATLTYADSKKDTELGIVLDTFSFAEPIQDLQGLTPMANGILAGFSGRTVAFSEAFLPHAWAVSNQQTTSEEIVAMKAIGNSVVVTTKGKPYLFSGVSPDAISGQKIEISQACVSSRSMVDMGEYVIYASPDGLVALGASTAELLTKNIFNKSTWKSYQPETIIAGYYEDKYVAFYGGVAGFIFDPRNGDFIELDFYATAMYNDLLTDTLYLCINNEIKSFDEATATLTFSWSKLIRLNFNVSPSCAYIDLEDPSKASFTMEVDGVEIVNHPDLSADGINQLPGESPVFRLPAIRGKECVFTISGTTKIHEIAVGSDMREVQNG